MENLRDEINKKLDECESLYKDRDYLAKNFDEFDEKGGYAGLLIFPENGEKCRVSITKEQVQMLVQPILDEFNKSLESLKTDINKFIDGLKLNI